jgi:hypothetical protein
VMGKRDVSDGSPNLDRRGFAAPPVQGTVRGIDLAALDPDDPDDRHFLILAVHPELWEAVEKGQDEVEIGRSRFNPQVHLTIHEIVANQLWDDEPPETWQTAQRLIASGYERHEVLHMLTSAVAEEIWGALQGGRGYDEARYLAALAALPDSWERQPRP